MTDTATRLRELRRSMKLTQHEVAKAIDVSDASYAMYETGERTPRDPIKGKISALFKKPVGLIFMAKHSHQASVTAEKCNRR